MKHYDLEVYIAAGLVGLLLVALVVSLVGSAVIDFIKWLRKGKQ